jgi:hypothetical protein
LCQQAGFHPAFCTSFFLSFQTLWSSYNFCPSLSRPRRSPVPSTFTLHCRAG